MPLGLNARSAKARMRSPFKRARLSAFALAQYPVGYPGDEVGSMQVSNPHLPRYIVAGTRNHRAPVNRRIVGVIGETKARESRR